MSASNETLTDREVIDLIMTSDEHVQFTPEEYARAMQESAARLARSREESKEWDRKAKLKDRKRQGGRRDYWAELLARDGMSREGFKVIPDEALSHKLKVNRTLTLERAEKRRKVRMEKQLLRETPTEDTKPWRKPVKNTVDMQEWLKVTGEKMRRDTEEVNRRKAERLRQSAYADTPEKRSEIKARAEVLAEVQDKDLRNHGYANRSGFMNSADESADLEDQGLCSIMDDNISEPFGGDD